MDLETTQPLVSLHLEGWVQFWAPWTEMGVSPEKCHEGGHLKDMGDLTHKNRPEIV